MQYQAFLDTSLHDYIISLTGAIAEFLVLRTAFFVWRTEVPVFELSFHGAELRTKISFGLGHFSSSWLTSFGCLFFRGYRLKTEFLEI